MHCSTIYVDKDNITSKLFLRLSTFILSTTFPVNMGLHSTASYNIILHSHRKSCTLPQPRFDQER